MSKKSKKMTKRKARKYLKVMENMKLNGTYITKKTDDFKFEPIDDIYTPIDFFYDSNFDHLTLNLNGLENNRCSTSLNSQCEITTIIQKSLKPTLFTLDPHCQECENKREDKKYCIKGINQDPSVGSKEKCWSFIGSCPYCNTTLEGNEKYCHWCGSLLLEEVKEK